MSQVRSDGYEVSFIPRTYILARSDWRIIVATPEGNEIVDTARSLWGARAKAALIVWSHKREVRRDPNQPNKPGVWVIFHYDLSAVAVFAANDELGARRSAGENQMHVTFCEFGQDIRELLS